MKNILKKITLVAFSTLLMLSSVSDLSVVYAESEEVIIDETNTSQDSPFSINDSFNITGNVTDENVSTPTETPTIENDVQVVGNTVVNESVKYYTITFFEKDHRDSWVVLDRYSVKAGDTFSVPTPNKLVGKTFVGWDKEVTNITEDVAIFAQYQDNINIARSKIMRFNSLVNPDEYNITFPLENELTSIDPTDTAEKLRDNPPIYGLSYYNLIPRAQRTANIKCLDIKLSDATLTGAGKLEYYQNSDSTIDPNFRTILNLRGMDETTRLVIRTSEAAGKDPDTGREFGIQMVLENFYVTPGVYSKTAAVNFGNTESFKTDFIESVDVSYSFYYLDNGEDAPLYAWGRPTGFTNQNHESGDNEGVMPRNFKNTYVDAGQVTIFGDMITSVGYSGYECYHSAIDGGNASVFWTTDEDSMDFTMYNVGKPDDGSPAYDTTFWMGYKWIAQWNMVLNNPVKQFADNHEEGDVVKPGETVTYAVSQLFGEWGADVSRLYTAFRMGDYLPEEVDFVSVKMLDENLTDITSQITDNIELAYNAEEHTVDVAFSNSFLQDETNYRGQWITMVIEVVVNHKVSETDGIITNEGYSFQNGHYLYTNIIELDTEPLYQIETEIENGEITDDITLIKPGSDEKVLYACNDGYYLTKLVINGEDATLGYSKDGINYVYNSSKDINGSWKKGEITWTNVQANHKVVASCDAMPDPVEKDFWNGSDYSQVEEGNQVIYEVTQKVQDWKDISAPYRSFILIDELPEQLVFDYAKVYDPYGNDVTTTAGTLKYDAAKHEVTFTFNKTTLSEESFYDGEVWTMEVGTKVDQNIPDGQIINKAYSIINGIQTEDEVESKANSYKIITDAENATIDPDIYGIQEGESKTIKFAPNEGYYISKVCVNNYKAEFNSCRDLTTAVLGQDFSNRVNAGSFKFDYIDSNKAIKVEALPIPQLVIEKTNEKHNYIVGEYATYTIKATQVIVNAEDQNVVIIDSGNSEYIEIDMDSISTNFEEIYANDTSVNGTVEITEYNGGFKVVLPKLAYDKPVTITYRAKTLKSSNDTNVLNTASITGTLDKTPDEDTEIITIEDPVQPELSINKINNKPSVKAGEKLTYTISVNQLMFGAESTNVIIKDSGAGEYIDTLHETINVKGVKNWTVEEDGNGFIIRIPVLKYGENVIITYDGKAKDIPLELSPIKATNTALVGTEGTPEDEWKDDSSTTEIIKVIITETPDSPTKSIIHNEVEILTLNGVIMNDEVTYSIKQKVHTLGENIDHRYSNFTFMDDIPEELTITSFKVVDENGNDITDTSGLLTIDENFICFDFSDEFLETMPLDGETYQFVITGTVNIKTYLEKVVGYEVIYPAGGHKFINQGEVIIEHFDLNTNIVTVNPIKVTNPSDPIKKIVINDKDYDVYSNAQIGNEVVYHVRQQVHSLGSNTPSRYSYFEIYDILPDDVDYVSAEMLDSEGKVITSGTLEYDVVLHKVSYVFDEEYLDTMPLDGETYSLKITVTINQQARPIFENVGNSIIEIAIKDVNEDPNDPSVKPPHVISRTETETNEVLVKLYEPTPAPTKPPVSIPTPTPKPNTNTGESGVSLILPISGLVLAIGVATFMVLKSRKKKDQE